MCPIVDGMAADTRIGTKIRRARERKRMSQQDLADVLGVSRSAVNAWERGRAHPRSSIGALEEVLGIVLDGEAEDAPPQRPHSPCWPTCGHLKTSGRPPSSPTAISPVT